MLCDNVVEDQLTHYHVANNTLFGILGRGEIEISDASQFPFITDVERFLEPLAKVTIISKSEYYDPITKLCESRRPKNIDVSYIGAERICKHYMGCDCNL